MSDGAIDHADALRMAKSWTDPETGYGASTKQFAMARAYLDAYEDAQRLTDVEEYLKQGAIRFRPFAGKWRVMRSPDEETWEDYATIREAIDAARVVQPLPVLR